MGLSYSYQSKASDSAVASDAPPSERELVQPPQPQTWGEILKAWPKATLCIVTNEFCEKFSYYGMRGLFFVILWLYFNVVVVGKYKKTQTAINFEGQKWSTYSREYQMSIM